MLNAEKGSRGDDYCPLRINMAYRVTLSGLHACPPSDMIFSLVEKERERKLSDIGTIPLYTPINHYIPVFHEMDIQPRAAAFYTVS